MDIHNMFIELVKGQTAITTEMRVRNEIDGFRISMDERREIRNARFTWGVLMLCAALFGIKGIEFLAGVGVIG